MRVLIARPAVVLRGVKFQRQRLSTKVQGSTQPTTVQDQARAARRAEALQVVQAIRLTRTRRVHHLQTRHRLRRLPTAVVTPPHPAADPATRMAPAATLTKAPTDNACRNSTGQPSFRQRLWRIYRLDRTRSVLADWDNSRRHRRRPSVHRRQNPEYANLSR